MSSALESLSPPKWVANKTAWLLSFIDLTSILTGFFVLMFSTQTIDRQTWTDVSGSFRAAFAPHVKGVLPVIPDGTNNAFVVSAGTPSGLGYLDALLHQRTASDPVWSALVAKSAGGEHAAEMFYELPRTVHQPSDPAAAAAYQRLAAVIRGWKNPVAVRAVVPPRSPRSVWVDASRRAIAAASLLGASAGSPVVAEVVPGPAAFVLAVGASR